MSREIKFRGYVEKIDDIGIDVPHEGHFVYGNLVHGNNFDCIAGGLIEANEEYASIEWWQTIQQGATEQYTGLKDKKGKEIYEGDIVQFPILGKPHREIVAWSDMDSAFIIGMMYLSRFQPKMEVLGNVHANPELLEEK